MSNTNDTLTIETKVLAKFRSMVFNTETACGNPAFTSSWLDSYAEAEEAMLNHLVDVGTGFAGEVEKVYMTSRTWERVLAAEEAEANA